MKNIYICYICLSYIYIYTYENHSKLTCLWMYFWYTKRLEKLEKNAAHLHVLALRGSDVIAQLQAELGEGLGASSSLE